MTARYLFRERGGLNTLQFELERAWWPSAIIAVLVLQMKKEADLRQGGKGTCL